MSADDSANVSKTETKDTIEVSEATSSIIPQKTEKNWVRFEEDDTSNNKINTPAVFPTETVHANITNNSSFTRSTSRSSENNVAILDVKPMRNVELPVATVEPIRQGFCEYLITTRHKN